MGNSPGQLTQDLDPLSLAERRLGALAARDLLFDFARAPRQQQQQTDDSERGGDGYQRESPGFPAPRLQDPALCDRDIRALSPTVRRSPDQGGWYRRPTRK